MRWHKKFNKINDKIVFCIFESEVVKLVVDKAIFSQKIQIFWHKNELSNDFPLLNYRGNRYPETQAEKNQG